MCDERRPPSSTFGRLSCWGVDSKGGGTTQFSRMRNEEARRPIEGWRASGASESVYSQNADGIARATDEVVRHGQQHPRTGVKNIARGTCQPRGSMSTQCSNANIGVVGPITLRRPSRITRICHGLRSTTSRDWSARLGTRKASGGSRCSTLVNAQRFRAAPIANLAENCRP